MPRKSQAKKSRAARGTGTVFYSASRKCHIARKPIGTRVRKGKRETVYLTRTGKTQAEAIRRRDAAGPPSAKTTLAEWAEQWRADLSVSPLSKDAYRASLDNHILPELGPVVVTKLTAHRIESAIRVWGKTVGATTVHNVLACLRACLAAAVRAELIVRNPVASAVKPRKGKAEIDPFPPADLVRIVDAAGADRETRACGLLAAVGMRVGEVVALDCSDFDPETGGISVTKGHRRQHGTGPTKSAHSTRTIRAPSDAAPLLTAARGDRMKGPLFLNAYGKRQQCGAVRYAWVALAKRLGLRFRNLHQFRHSVATMMVGANVPITDVAVYLGDTVETVVRTYLHPTGTDPADAIERVFAAVKGACKVTDEVGQVAPKA